MMIDTKCAQGSLGCRRIFSSDHEKGYLCICKKLHMHKYVHAKHLCNTFPVFNFIRTEKKISKISFKFSVRILKEQAKKKKNHYTTEHSKQNSRMKLKTRNVQCYAFTQTIIHDKLYTEFQFLKSLLYLPIMLHRFSFCFYTTQSKKKESSSLYRMAKGKWPLKEEFSVGRSICDRSQLSKHQGFYHEQNSPFPL